MVKNLVCPKCHREGAMVRTETLEDGSFVASCMYCDLPQEDPPEYENHCWNCSAPVDSETCRKSKIPNMGYHCNACGKDLFEYKMKKGLIKSEDLAQIIGGGLGLGFLDSILTVS